MTDLLDHSDSRAVLIGVSRFTDPNLPDVPAALNSLGGMRTLLTDPLLCGWPTDRITVIADPANAADILTELRRLAKETTGTLLIYFVGHGLFTGRSELIMATGDTDHAEPDIRGLEYEKIKRTLRDSPAESTIVILDCCYSGQVLQSLGGDPVPAAVTVEGVYTLTAADHDKTAHVVAATEQAAARTSFTEALIDVVRDGMTDGSPVMTLHKMFPLLQRRLAARALPEPRQLAVGTMGDFPFARNAATAQAPVPGKDVSPKRGQALLIYRGSARRIDADGRPYGETGGAEAEQLEADRKWWPIAAWRLPLLQLLVIVVGGVVTRVREVKGVDTNAGTVGRKVALLTGPPLTAEQIAERYPTLPTQLGVPWPTRLGPSREFIEF